MIGSSMNKRKTLNKILVVMIITGSIGITLPIFTIQIIPLVHAVDQNSEWNITLRITDTEGTANTVNFGIKNDATNTLDQYDLPEPPAPPKLPFIRAWFETSFKTPFESLLQEYQSSSSEQVVWNLSVLWITSSQNTSNTTLTLTWNSSVLDTNFPISLLLYEDDRMVSDMITEKSYSFLTNSSIHHFQIIYQQNISNNVEHSIEVPLLPIVLGGIISITVIGLIVFNKRKKN